MTSVRFSIYRYDPEQSVMRNEDEPVCVGAGLPANGVPWQGNVFAPKGAPTVMRRMIR